MRTSRLTAILERTLDAKAAQATDADAATAPRPFVDPARRTSTAGDAHDSEQAAAPSAGAVPDHPDHPDDVGVVGVVGDAPWATPDSPPAGRRRRLLVPAAAACVAVAALVGGALVVRGGGSDDPAVQTRDLGDPPDGWLVPTWVPEGMALWAVDTSAYEPSDESGPGTVSQLFGDADGDRAVLVTSQGYEIRPGSGEDVAVRGVTGEAGDGWGVAEEDMGAAVTWEERGLTLSALYRGVSRAEAIAMLDALEWRSDDPADGFAPPGDAALPLRAEATGGPGIERDASFVYTEGVPTADGSGPELSVHTTSSGSSSAFYLEAWYVQGATGDGTRPITTYRDGGELTVFWPDGRYVVVSPQTAGGPMSRETLERVASSVTVASTADLAGLRAEAESRIGALPVLATADTAIGAVDVHGEGGYVRLCLRRPGADGPVCDTSGFGGGQTSDGTAFVSAQWTIDGSWVVVAATTGEPPMIVDGSDPDIPLTDAADLPTDTVAADGWTVQLVRPGPDVESVCLGSEAAMSCSPQPLGSGSG